MTECYKDKDSTRMREREKKTSVNNSGCRSNFRTGVHLKPFP